MGNRAAARIAREGDGRHAGAHKRQQADGDVGGPGLQVRDHKRHGPRNDTGAAAKEHAAPRPQPHVHLRPKQKQDGPAKTGNEGEQPHDRQGHPRTNRKREHPRCQHAGKRGGHAQAATVSDAADPASQQRHRHEGPDVAYAHHVVDRHLGRDTQFRVYEQMGQVRAAAPGDKDPHAQKAPGQQRHAGGLVVAPAQIAGDRPDE